ncbi:hypothetical protein ACFLV2_01440 [Chloroflexota bacterium]
MKTLEGKKIGVINNTKNGGEILWPFIEEELRKRYPKVEFREWRIGFAFVPEEKEPMLQEVTAYSDGVIAFMGD